MRESVYDMPISEVAKVLGKSDRQVRRYVKVQRLMAQPTPIDGHIKLMFSKDEVVAFSLRPSKPRGPQILVDGQLLEGHDGVEPGIAGIAGIDDGESAAVKYVIDALREQICELRKDTQDLHYQLEQRSGQVGFLQGKVEALEEEMKALMPARPAQDQIIEKKPWYRRMFGR